MSGPIDVKTAVRNAIAYLREFEEFIPARGLRLEETEYDGSGSWLITLSVIDDDPRFFGELAGTKRTYKVFRIDAETGEVKSMKVRSLQPVE
jgi:hypothetical protein